MTADSTSVTQKACQMPVGPSWRQSSHAIRQAYLQARRALWEAALSKESRACVFYGEQSDGAPGQEPIAGTQRQIDELIAKDSLFADFKAVKNGNVWCTGKYLFQATDITGELIVDFHHMLTGQEDMQFLYKLK